MALSSGSRAVLSEMAVWVCLACSPAAGWLLYQHLRPALGLDAADAVTDLRVDRVAPSTVAAEPGISAKRRVELRADAGGHFFAGAHINGSRINVMVDTGATIVALTFEDAERAGIFPRDADFTGRVSTANGTARVAYVTLDSVSIDDITVRGVKAAVAEPGRLGTSLLGMSFLGKLRTEIARGKLVLED
jgi:aspartyl protease family protein